MTTEPWTMPGWMEPYRSLIPTGGESIGITVERMMAHDHPDGAMWERMCAATRGRVNLLTALHERGLLASPEGRHS